MKKPKRIFLKLQALFFAGAITAATLRGCTYGPPPAENIIKTRDTITQNNALYKAQEYVRTNDDQSKNI